MPNKPQVHGRTEKKVTDATQELTPSEFVMWLAIVDAPPQSLKAGRVNLSKKLGYSCTWGTQLLQSLHRKGYITMVPSQARPRGTGTTIWIRLEHRPLFSFPTRLSVDGEGTVRLSKKGRVKGPDLRSILDKKKAKIKLDEAKWAWRDRAKPNAVSPEEHERLQQGISKVKKIARANRRNRGKNDV